MYVLGEIINKEVLEQFKDDIDDDFFDEFYFIDSYLGSSKFYNEDPVADKKLEGKEEKLDNSIQKPIIEQSEKTNTKKKRQPPELDERKIEVMILSQVFNIVEL